MYDYLRSKDTAKSADLLLKIIPLRQAIAASLGSKAGLLDVYDSKLKKWVERTSGDSRSEWLPVESAKGDVLRAATPPPKTIDF